MNGLIRASLNNPRAVTVSMLAILFVGGFAIRSVPIDILPVFRSPAVQVLTFYGGMVAGNMEKDITSRMERWTGQASGMKRQESRSIIGASIIRNYFHDDVDPSGALTQVNSLASAAVPNLPPGTLPPVILPYDPTGTVPACIVALDSEGKENEATMYDVGRYEVRNYIMASPGAVAPVVYGGKIRCVLAYLDRALMQGRNLSLLDVMRALDEYNLFLPAGDAKLGDIDYAIDSNSMYDLPEKMGEIPLRVEPNNATFLRDIGTARDTAFIQTNVVRVNGRRQVYIPVFRQVGSSTLDVVEDLKAAIPEMQPRLSKPDINLKVVMDQSIYVRQSIKSLAQEGTLGAILCSLVILVFLGQWRMTVIAVFTIPISVMAAVIGLYATGNTINVMTLAGLALAIGPMVDSAIICLENTHRHLMLGERPKDAAFNGASEVAMPELVASLCTFLVLSPLALMPGMGRFLFRPMAIAVTLAMSSAYVLSRSFVPTFSYLLLKPHVHGGEEAPRGWFAAQFARWDAAVDRSIEYYVRGLDFCLRHRIATVTTGFGMLALVLVTVGPVVRRDFFPEVDAGAFEMTVRAATGTRIEVMEERVAEVEQLIRDTIEKDDLQMVISELGVTPDWSAAYTPNAGPMDSIIRVQLNEEREHSAQEYVHLLRTAAKNDSRFAGLEFSFDAGGMIRGAINEGKSTPINVRIDSKTQQKAREVASRIQREVEQIEGVVDCRIVQRLDYPEFMIDVDRDKAADLGFTQADVMKNVVSAINSSIQFNKRNFWIDPVTHNQYFVGVQYPERDIKDLETLLDVPVTSPVQGEPVNLRTIAGPPRRTQIAAEVNHINLQPTIDLTMGVYGRDLGHVANEVHKIVAKFGQPRKPLRGEGRGEGSTWVPFDPDSEDPQHPQVMEGSKLVISGEYSKMNETFMNLGIGLVAASVLIYFLMVGLFRSYMSPLAVMSIVPLCLIGILPMLLVTGSAVNVQSLLGFIFIVGIKVANSVLMTDFAQELREREGLTPTEAIRKAASVRVKPVTMTALAAFFAMIPTAMALERGSEANAPLARAILGGLFAGEPATLFVLPVIYSLMIRDKRPQHDNG